MKNNDWQSWSSWLESGEFVHSTDLFPLYQTTHQVQFSTSTDWIIWSARMAKNPLMSYGYWIRNFTQVKLVLEPREGNYRDESDHLVDSTCSWIRLITQNTAYPRYASESILAHEDIRHYGINACKVVIYWGFHSFQSKQPMRFFKK